MAESSVIERIEARSVELPTGMKPFILPNGHLTPTALCALVLRVVDTDGTIGYSLLWGQREPQLQLFVAGLRHVANVALDPAAGEPTAFVAAARQATTFVGHEGVTAFAISGIEMALQDLRCRRAETSLGALLGRRTDEIRAYQTGLMLSQDEGELIDEALSIHAGGIRAIKMIVGKPTLAEDVARIEAVRGAIPDDMTLMVDALQRWTLDQALEATTALADFGLQWIEDPIRHDDLAGYRRLVETSAIRISTGETAFSIASFDRLLDIGVPLVIAEPERVGGVSGWVGLAKRVAERGGSLLPHIYPHLSAQMLCSLDQPEIWWEYVPWFDQLVEDRLTITDGLLTVPSAAGSGFNPDLDSLERVATTPWISLTS